MRHPCKVLLCFVLIPILLFSATSWEEQAPGGFSVKASFSSETISLQDQLNIQLVVKYPSGYHLNTGALRGHLLQNDTPGDPPFELANEKILPSRIMSNGIVQQEIVYTLNPKLVGKYSLTFLGMPFNSSDPKTKPTVEIVSPIMPVTIIKPHVAPSFHPEPANLLGLAPVLPVTMSAANKKMLIDSPEILQEEAERNQSIFAERSTPWYLLFLAFVVVISYFGLRHLFEYLLELQHTPEKMRKAAQTKALKTIDAILKENLPQQNLFDDYYVKLTDTVRHYIENTYRLNAPASTTQEFLQNISTNAVFNQNSKNLLANFLVASDLVKFGKHTPSPLECDNAAKAAKQFIYEG